ncbi:hypothetical protein PGTUg99_024937 [Puccinia graminis f. sp. tritici]|uniref:TNFR-Cys domain-containing protein n=1 Tax=Puccinia graminis f. sp. tritici TaxID=56615 RepID=A0A5B0R884_PUCGR|nr:hypothetical protein PGTUg99_024937 [Puccinia graminis f. sp. tritici]
MIFNVPRYLFLAGLLLINQSLAASCSVCDGKLREVSYSVAMCNEPITCDKGETHGTCTATKYVSSMVCKKCNTPSIVEECEQKDSHNRLACSAHTNTEPFWKGTFRGWDGQSD